MDRHSRTNNEGPRQKRAQFGVELHPTYTLIGIEGDSSQPFDAAQTLQSEIMVDGRNLILITGNLAEKAAGYLLTRIQNPTMVVVTNETGSSLRVISSNREEFPVGRVLGEGDEEAMRTLLKGGR